MKWISVEDKLPEEKAYVIVYDGNDVFQDAYYQRDEFFFLGKGDIRIKGVTHWMPLPPAPKDQCCDGPHVAYRGLEKDEPIVETCVIHKAANITHEKFMEIVREYWYRQGKQEGMRDKYAAFKAKVDE